MIERIVSNTSSLLALTKMQMLDVVGKLPYQFICPAEVETEIRDGAKQGHQIEIPAWLTVVPLANPLSPLAVAALDTGEAAVIQLALEQGIPLVCIDELKGRRAALAVGLRIVGSLGLIGKAKTLNLIPQIRPLIEKAKNAGIYYDNLLIKNFLQSLGE